MSDCEVLVVGGGPVGLTLAIALGQQGVRVQLIELKNEPAFLPKMERTNARSMELFRRLGLADRIRAASKYTPYPMDIFLVSRLNEPAVLRLPYPSVPEAKKLIAECRDGTQPLEPYQLISQYTLEPLLKSVAEEMPGVEVRFGVELVSLTQDDDGVTATVKEGDATSTIEAAYLAGCDGGTSTVRKELGIELEGSGNIRKMLRLFFRSEELFDKIACGHGRHYQFPECGLVVQDDLKHFMSNFYQLEEGEDPVEKLKQITGIDFDVEVMDLSPWRMSLLVANRMRVGRAFIAGDAAHLVIPHGGLGMNTGIGDAVDLAWKLAGTLAGWGGPGMLDSYDAERRQIAMRNVDASRAATQGALGWRDVCAPNFRDQTPAGEETRARVRRFGGWGQKDAHDMRGIEQGYRYIHSPIIYLDEEEGEGPDPDAMLKYTPSTWPGARLPHVWLDDGGAMQDRLGPGFTLLKLAGSKADTSALEQALRSGGAAFEVLEIGDGDARAVYERDLILLRPDLHVVWRGNAPPRDPEKVAAVALGKVSAAG